MALKEDVAVAVAGVLEGSRMAVGKVSILGWDR